MHIGTKMHCSKKVLVITFSDLYFYIFSYFDIDSRKKVLYLLNCTQQIFLWLCPFSIITFIFAHTASSSSFQIIFFWKSTFFLNNLWTRRGTTRRGKMWKWEMEMLLAFLHTKPNARGDIHKTITISRRFLTWLVFVIPTWTRVITNFFCRVEDPFFLTIHTDLKPYFCPKSFTETNWNFVIKSKFIYQFLKNNGQKMKLWFSVLFK